MTTHNHLTTTPHDTPRRPRCQVCQERDGQAYLGALLVCGECFADAKDEAVSLWRASLRLVRDGWPR